MSINAKFALQIIQHITHEKDIIHAIIYRADAGPERFAALSLGQSLRINGEKILLVGKRRETGAAIHVQRIAAKAMKSQYHRLWTIQRIRNRHMHAVHARVKSLRDSGIDRYRLVRATSRRNWRDRSE